MQLSELAQEIGVGKLRFTLQEETGRFCDACGAEVDNLHAVENDALCSECVEDLHRVG